MPQTWNAEDSVRRLSFPSSHAHRTRACASLCARFISQSSIAVSPLRRCLCAIQSGGGVWSRLWVHRNLCVVRFCHVTSSLFIQRADELEHVRVAETTWERTMELRAAWSKNQWNIKVKSARDVEISLKWQPIKSNYTVWENVCMVNCFRVTTMDYSPFRNQISFKYNNKTPYLHIYILDW